MSDLFGNHIVGFPTRRLIFNTGFVLKDCYDYIYNKIVSVFIYPLGHFILRVLS